MDVYPRWALITIALAFGCGRLGFDSSGEDAVDAAVDPPIDAELEVNVSFTLGAAVSELGVQGFESDDAALTGDLTELYFASTRPGGLGSGADIYRARRASQSEPWGPLENVNALSTTGSESTIALSSNGLFVVYGSSLDDPAGDVYLASRANRNEEFGTPFRLTELNSVANESASWISDDGLSIWIHSDRDGDGDLDFDVFQSSRPDLSSPFSPPTRITALSDPNLTEISATLHDRFALLSISDGDGHDLFVAPRIGETMTFEDPVALVGPNTVALETDPWLSPDGCVLFFARRVDDLEQVFEASCSSE